MENGQWWAMATYGAEAIIEALSGCYLGLYIVLVFFSFFSMTLLAVLTISL